MPRSRMLLQLDDELVLAKQALAFWREQKTILAETPLHECAAAAVKAQEDHIKRLVEIQEGLAAM